MRTSASPSSTERQSMRAALEENLICDTRATLGIVKDYRT